MFETETASVKEDDVCRSQLFRVSKMFQNNSGIVLGFDNLCVLNFDAHYKSDTNYQKPSE
jgi:hypothetical protein